MRVPRPFEQHYAYLDESYSEFGKVHFVGCCIASESTWDVIDQDLGAYRKECVRRFELPDDIEFHAYEISGGRGAWKPLRGRHRDAVKIFETILTIAHDNDVTHIIRGVDVTRLKAQYLNPEDPLLVAFRSALETVDEFATVYQLQDEVIVVADEHPDSAQFSSEVDLYRKRGANLYRPQALMNVSDPINFCDSRSVTGLQVADCVAYNRRRFSDVPKPGALEAQSRLRLKEVMEPRYWQSGLVRL